jgi:uncharacterized protein YrrD
MVAHSLIASDRVEGTPVVRAATGTKIGTIQRLMISKRSGFRLCPLQHTRRTNFERLAALAPFRCEAQWVGTRSFICELK